MLQGPFHDEWAHVALGECCGWRLCEEAFKVWNQQRVDYFGHFFDLKSSLGAFETEIAKLLHSRKTFRARKICALHFLSYGSRTLPDKYVYDGFRLFP